MIERHCMTGNFEPVLEHSLVHCRHYIYHERLHPGYFHLPFIRMEFRRTDQAFGLALRAYGKLLLRPLSVQIVEGGGSSSIFVRHISPVAVGSYDKQCDCESESKCRG